MACLRLSVSSDPWTNRVHDFALFIHGSLIMAFLKYLSIVSVGFEYESCPDFILWEKRTAVLQGYETTASKLGGWTVDKHHALNIQSGESTIQPLLFSYLLVTAHSFNYRLKS